MWRWYISKGCPNVTLLDKTHLIQEQTDGPLALNVDNVVTKEHSPLYPRLLIQPTCNRLDAGPSRISPIPNHAPSTGNGMQGEFGISVFRRLKESHGLFEMGTLL